VFRLLSEDLFIDQAFFAQGNLNFRQKIVQMTSLLRESRKALKAMGLKNPALLAFVAKS